MSDSAVVPTRWVPMTTPVTVAGVYVMCSPPSAAMWLEPYAVGGYWARHLPRIQGRRICLTPH